MSGDAGRTSAYATITIPNATNSRQARRNVLPIILTRFCGMLARTSAKIARGLRRDFTGM
jgi:hypothetical protein